MPDRYYDAQGRFLYEERLRGELNWGVVRYFQEVARRSNGQLGTIYSFQQVKDAPKPQEDYGE